ncbi:HD domain-containing protein [Nitratireductor sp. StC3]|uniref:HD domain-containing protein n=1 Tax=Nitratireductor sp. StC3 TaxID=2126741 RepID=UPI0011B1F201|nr:HD domain-containing protein [Nitratireductor sp. StC3]
MPSGVPCQAFACAWRAGALNFSTLLAGLHDLGKFSAPFQAKRPDLWPAAALGRLDDVGIDGGHWCYTALLMHEGGVAASRERAFKAAWREIRDEIVAVVAGHHGRPPAAEWLGVSGPRGSARTLRSEKRALPTLACTLPPKPWSMFWRGRCSNPLARRG